MLLFSFSVLLVDLMLRSVGTIMGTFQARSHGSVSTGRTFSELTAGGYGLPEIPMCVRASSREANFPALSFRSLEECRSFL